MSIINVTLLYDRGRGCNRHDDRLRLQRSAKLELENGFVWIFKPMRGAEHSQQPFRCRGCIEGLQGAFNPEAWLEEYGLQKEERSAPILFCWRIYDLNPSRTPDSM